VHGLGEALGHDLLRRYLGLIEAEVGQHYAADRSHYGYVGQRGGEHLGQPLTYGQHVGVLIVYRPEEPVPDEQGEPGSEGQSGQDDQREQHGDRRLVLVVPVLGGVPGALVGLSLEHHEPHAEHVEGGHEGREHSQHP